MELVAHGRSEATAGGVGAPARTWWWRLGGLALGLALAGGCGGHSARAADPSSSSSSFKIIKVLPHYLDQKGRHVLSPSLYERDAYQAYLRLHPDQCAGVRFDVQWRGRLERAAPLRLKLEIRAGGLDAAQPFTCEQVVRARGMWSRWTGIKVEGETYRKLGKIIAWRVSVWEGDRRLAHQQSFLW